MLEHLNVHLPGTTVMGGVVSGGLGPGRARLFLDDKVLDSGAVGVRLPGWRAVAVVSQGCRPIGQAYTVTGARGPVITELGGRPPDVRRAGPRRGPDRGPARRHPVAGFFAAGELGPVGGRNALHGFTASLALFLDEPRDLDAARCPRTTWLHRVAGTVPRRAPGSRRRPVSAYDLW